MQGGKNGKVRMIDYNDIRARHPLATEDGFKLVMVFLAVDEAIGKKRMKFFDKHGKRLTTPEGVMDCLKTEGTVRMEKFK